MESISLNGCWKLYWRFPEHDITSSLPDFTKLESVSAEVPGNVEIDLNRAGLLPDIFFGDNIWETKPWEPAEWFYCRSFEVSKELIENGADLLFGGLDCFADIWVNNTCIGSCDNMMIEHQIDLKGVLRPGQNNLIVHIKSAAVQGRKHIHDAFETAMTVNWESLPVRKASHMYGRS